MVYCNMKTKNKNKKKYDRSYQELTERINNKIKQNKKMLSAGFEEQREQVELVLSLEKKLQYQMSKYKTTRVVFKKFIDFIIREEGNILRARPYFREQSGVFSKYISKLLKVEDINGLLNYQMNYQLLIFLVNNWPGKMPEKVEQYWNDYVQARKILIENNLPLVINRALLFYRKTAKSEIDLLEFIDIATIGLINGIDKYVGKYTTVWRSVAIGRMVGLLIEQYSKTFLRLYPNDAKILYRANALRHRKQIDDLDELTKAVNESFVEDEKQGMKIPALPIEREHISSLLNGVSYTPVGLTTDQESSNSNNSIYDHTPSLDQPIEDAIIHADALNKVSSAMKQLTILERKVLKLKGVEL